ncbi:MAG: BatD family protein [Akkermansiaceae bacterium]|jgi:hypothetical protein
MFRNSLFLVFAILLTVTRPVDAQNAPSLTASLGSSLIVEGETTILTIELNGLQTIGWPASPRVSPLTLRQYKQGNMQRNGRITEVFQYTISSIRSGLFTIPAFEVTTSQGISKSEPLTLRVFPADELSVNGLRLNSSTVPYLSGIFLEKESPFSGEPQHVEAKLYIPNGQPNLLRLKLAQFADLEKSGIAAWRFDGLSQPSGLFEREGIKFEVYTYSSSITPLQEGPLAIGPGKASPIVQRRTQNRGRFRIDEEVLEFKFPAKSFTARALPQPVPDNFEGAVGNFTVMATPLTRQLELGDTVTVDLQVIGNGNIDQFPGPKLQDPEGNWKQFEMTATPQGGERRSSSGTVKFTQVVRPIKKAPALPPYQFIFFDPVLEQYRTVQSDPQALVITGEELPAAGEPVPGELAFLTPSSRPLKSFSTRRSTPVWAWQLIPALIVVGFLVARLLNHLKWKQQVSLPAREFQNELQEISQLASNRIQFYRAAANFATRWKGTAGFEKIHQTRDEICFTPDAQAEPVAATEKNRILNLLKQLSPLVLVALFVALQTATSSALDQDPAKAREEILSSIQSNPSPEHFYNLALCEEALGNSGEAALLAYRYELQGGNAQELLKRLPGSRALTREGSEWVSIYAKFYYQQALAAAAWALVFILILRGRPAKWPLVILSIIGSLGILAGIPGWLLYPDGVGFKPLHQMSVVTSKTPIQSQPYEGGNKLRDEVEGSLCFVTATRGEWTHLELPDGLTGWVPNGSVVPINLLTLSKANH